MGYKEDISVNKYSLDEAWEENPDLCVKYSDLSVDANTVKEQKELFVEKVEDELKSLLSELSLKVKFNYKDHEFIKPPSDDTAKSWAIQQPEYKEKQQELYKAKEESIQQREKSFKLRNAAQAFGERRYVIQNLQHLFMANYYSESGRNDVKEVKEVKEEREDKIENSGDINVDLNNSMLKRRNRG